MYIHTSHAACTDGARTASRPGLCVDAKDGLQVAPGELRRRTSGTITGVVVDTYERAVARAIGAVVVVVVVDTVSAAVGGTIGVAAAWQAVAVSQAHGREAVDRDGAGARACTLCEAVVLLCRATCGEGRWRSGCYG